MSVPCWEDPPPPTRAVTSGGKKQGLHAPAARQLRANPGRWGVVMDTPVTSTAGTLTTRIRRGLGGFDPAGAFEAVMRTTARGARYRVYARFVGCAAVQEEVKTGG